MFFSASTVLTETFYQAYQNGEEPEDDAWVLDWNEWAGTDEILLQRQEMYRQAIQALLEQESIASLSQLIRRTARRESIPIAGKPTLLTSTKRHKL